MPPVSTLGMVDRSLTAALEFLQPMELTREALPAIRQVVAEALATQDVPDFRGRVEERHVAAGDGHMIRLLVITPDERTAPGPAILQIHGGGFVIGNADMGLAAHCRLAAATGATLISVDYRLAPEAPYPQALEDCYRVLEWLHDPASNIDVDVARIAVKGDSAGAGLAAALALLARDRRRLTICHQILIYPMLDDRTGSIGDRHPYTGEFVWTAANNRFGWAALLGRDPGGDDVPAYAAPARARDLEDLPSTFISAGALDLFVEEDVEFARRLMRAGVDTELHVYPGAYHGFDFSTESPLVEAMFRDMATSLRRAFY